MMREYLVQFVVAVIPAAVSLVVAVYLSKREIKSGLTAVKRREESALVRDIKLKCDELEGAFGKAMGVKPESEGRIFHVQDVRQRFHSLERLVSSLGGYDLQYKDCSKSVLIGLHHAVTDDHLENPPSSEEEINSLLDSASRLTGDFQGILDHVFHSRHDRS